MQPHKFDTDGVQLATNLTSLEQFMQVGHKNGFICMPALKKVDKFAHIDVHMFNPTTMERYDVDHKGPKGIRKGDPPQDEYLLIEMVGITGMPGWIHGLSTNISFDHSNCFLMVDTEQLLKLTTSLMTNTIIYDLHSDMNKNLYHTYCRRSGNSANNLDEVVYIRTSDLSLLQSWAVTRWYK